MVIDVHCHILPNIDDGAKDEKTTKNMLKIAFEEGIDAMVATPHFVRETDESGRRERQRKFEQVRQWWKELNPQGELYLGNELYYREGITEALEQGYAMTMNGTKYVLVEFPEYESFSYIQQATRNLLYAGYIPIIAHVERYGQMRKKALVQELVDTGAYIQVNASAFLGKYGFRMKHYVIGLAKSGCVHFVATDAHDYRHRRPELRECRQYLEKKIGIGMTRKILEKNPAKMLKGEEL